MTISFRSLDRKGHYLQAVNGLNIALKNIERGNLQASKEATFILRKGLVDNSLFSFELLNKPKYYLRYEDGTLVPKLLQDNNFQFKDDASWYFKPALAKVDFINIDFD